MNDILTINLAPGPIQYRPGSDFGKRLTERDRLERAKQEAEALLERRQGELARIRQAIQADYTTDPADLVEPMAMLNPLLVVTQACETRAKEANDAYVHYSEWAVIGNKLSRCMERLAVLRDETANTNQSPNQRQREIEQVLDELERLTGVRPA